MSWLAATVDGGAAPRLAGRPAFAFNSLGIALAAFGALSPVIAGGAMAFSSFFVVSNALLLQRWRPKA